MTEDLYRASAWANAFGLAEAPLFARDQEDARKHRLLLDGGQGSFALSIDDKELPTDKRQSWIWSADVPHHVWLRKDRVAVARWDDDESPREFSLPSIASRFEAFYTYISSERVDRTKSVVNHTLRFFRFVRSAVFSVGADDSIAVDVFLAVLAAFSKTGQELSAAEVGDAAKHAYLDPKTAEVFAALPKDRVASLVENFAQLRIGRRALDLDADLALRHASGLIFQESHFELLRAPDPDLLGYMDAPVVRSETRGGVHFTPPAIARIVVERAFDSVPEVLNQKVITVLDPACGSGAFLQEAMRVLERRAYRGTIRLVGRDISPHAVKMARFTLLRAAMDFPPGQSVDIDVEEKDFFDDARLPAPDIVVMNPPFIAFGALSKRQREIMRQVFGDSHHGRADFCTAFITTALRQLKTGGALGALFPANLLFLENAKKWRASLVDGASLRFLASIGEHGLFAQALVQIGSMVLVKGDSNSNQAVLTVLTSDDKTATGAALRAVRKVANTPGLSMESSKAWEVSWLPQHPLVSRSDWRIRPFRIASFLERLSGPALTNVGSVFRVQQGVQTGSYETFVLSIEEWKKLPAGERKFFRKAVMNSSIRSGALTETHMVFFPYKDAKPLLETEEQLTTALPTYFQEYLEPARPLLEARPAVRMHGRWWLLNRPRSWAVRKEPRLISKYFGDVGGVALDLDGSFLVVQGFGWNLRSAHRSRVSNIRYALESVGSPGLLRTYFNIVNSKPFMTLVSAFSKQVAGGQFDLGPRFVNDIPIPDLSYEDTEGSRSQIIFNLESDEFDWRGELARRQSLKMDEMIADLYGVPLSEWPL